MLPMDWNEWRSQWMDWLHENKPRMPNTFERIKGKNFMADEILGTWEIPGRGIVELSEVRFMDHRSIGVTWKDNVREAITVQSFSDLETELFDGSEVPA